MVSNKVTLIGRLGKDIEIRKTDGDVSVASFSLAVNRAFNKNKDHPETDWIDCVAWRGTADFAAKYFHKGDKMAVTGRLQVRKYTGKDEIERRVTEVIIDEVEFVEGKKQGSAATDSVSAATANEYADEPDEDSDPF